MLITWLLPPDMLRVVYCVTCGKPYPQSSESLHVPGSG